MDIKERYLTKKKVRDEDAVNATTFYRLFQDNPEGRIVFEFLLEQFYYPCNVGDDAIAVAANEGQRSVMDFIIKKMLQALEQQEQASTE